MSRVLSKASVMDSSATHYVSPVDHYLRGLFPMTRSKSLTGLLECCPLCGVFCPRGCTTEGACGGFVVATSSSPLALLPPAARAKSLFSVRGRGVTRSSSAGATHVPLPFSRVYVTTSCTSSSGAPGWMACGHRRALRASQLRQLLSHVQQGDPFTVCQLVSCPRYPPGPVGWTVWRRCGPRRVVFLLCLRALLRGGVQGYRDGRS